METRQRPHVQPDNAKKIGHTPGPWKVGKPYGISKVEIEGPSVTPGASVLVAASEPRNAPLIAAAPDLLTACMLARGAIGTTMANLNLPDEEGGLLQATMEAVNAAIAKAGGAA